jgi:hypothetical protein
MWRCTPPLRLGRGVCNPVGAIDRRFRPAGRRAKIPFVKPRPEIAMHRSWAFGITTTGSASPEHFEAD